MSTQLILASTSKYRAELLGRICSNFTQQAPDCDETPRPDEIPLLLSERLAAGKARSVAEKNPEALVIGSDQVASLAGKPLGKPGNYDNAFQQLSECSGHNVDFYTSVNILRLSDNTEFRHTDHTRVCFKTLPDTLIEIYLKAETPYDCAGSFKSEGLGVILFEHIDSNDPTGLIGLPLIWVADALSRGGYDLFAE